MPKLPTLSCRELVDILQTHGYEIDHQQGSQIILRTNAWPHQRLTDPNHRMIAKGTLRAIIRQSGLSVDQFINP